MSGRGRRSSRRCRINSTMGCGTINIEVTVDEDGGGGGAENSVLLEPSSTGNDNKTDDNDTSPSQSQLWRETNAMLNPVILKNLFEVCPSDQLKTFRLVCQLWNDIALDRWRSTVVVNASNKHEKSYHGIRLFYDDRGLPRPGFVVKSETADERHEVTTTELLRYLTIPLFKLEIKPYRKFHFRGVGERTDMIKISDRRMMRFWTVFGQQMHELIFGGFKFDSVDTFRNLFCRWTPNLKKLALNINVNEVPVGICDPTVVVGQQLNLTSLNINFFTFLYRIEENKFPLPWMDFLSTFPNLQEIELSFVSSFSEFHGILEAIGRIRADNPECLRLKKLDISRVTREAIREFPIETARLINRLRLPLEYLDADIGYKTTPAAVDTIIHAPHKTIKRLTLFRAPFSGPFPNFLNHDQYDNLKVLQLYGPFTWDFSFLRSTPNLEILHVFLEANFISYLPIFMRMYRRNVERKVDFLDDMVAATAQRFNMSQVRLEKLKTFCGEFEIKAPESIRLLAEWMPNVTHLGLHLGKATFSAVCQAFPNLTCLCVYSHNDVDDEAITGVPIGCAIGARCSSRLGKKLVPQPEARPPNITSLKKLKRFTLSRPSNHPFECTHLLAKLTDHSVTYGFLCMPALEHLNISMASSVSRKNLEALKKKLGPEAVTTIVTSTCTCGITSIPE